jgi:hypothetical protein
VEYIVPDPHSLHTSKTVRFTIIKNTKKWQTYSTSSFKRGERLTQLDPGLVYTQRALREWLGKERYSERMAG